MRLRTPLAAAAGAAALALMAPAMLALAPAQAANIDTTGTPRIGTLYFGSDTPTYGQTFTADATQTSLTGFSLFLDLAASDSIGPLDL